MFDSTKYIPGKGPIGAKVMFVGEAPSYAELEAGEPFIGPSGRELDKLCKDIGYNRYNAWVTNACKFYVPPNIGTKKIPFQVRAKMAGINLDEQLHELQNEINSISPNVIIALGGTALWALTGKTSITNYRGSILSGMGRKCIPTFHPAHLLHSETGEFKGYWNRQLMLFDLTRALKQSSFPEIKLPYRNLQVCRDSAQFYDFIQRYKSFTKPAIDIEAGGSCVPICVGIAFTPQEGITIPLWPNDVVNIPQSNMVTLWLMLANLLINHDCIGQNFKYDQDKLARLGFLIRSLASDVMLKGFAINPELPKRLAFFQSIYTEEPFYKDEGMYEGNLLDLFIGCARDSCVTKEIDLAMDADLDELEQRPFFENFLMQLHGLYLDIENEGFTVDYKARDALFDKYVRWSERLHYELYCLTGTDINVDSPKQVNILLYDTLNLPRRPGVGEEELTALLNNQGKTGVHKPEHRRIIELILEERRVNKSVGNYLLALPDYDKKMKTSYFICNETGRTSTTQLDPPVRPLIEVENLKGKKVKKAIGTAFQTMTKHGDIGEDVRSQYIAEPYHIFVQADKAQAEARVVFLLADDEQALKDIDTHDYHALTASWFFGGTEDDYSKKKLGYESPIRFAGKTLRHAGHLGAGKRKAATELNTQARKYKIPISINEAEAYRALKIFHLKQPKIQRVFQAGIIECLNRNRRVLTASVPYGIDARIGGRRTFFERYGDELFRQAFSYIPQRAITDSTKADALRIKKRIPSIRIIMEAHDALLFMIPEKNLDEWIPIIKEEMERPIRFDTCSIPRRDLVVPCDIEIGYNYQELKKFKFTIPIEQHLIEPPEELDTRLLTTTERFRVG